MTDPQLGDIALTTLDGRATTLAELAAGAALVVNVASRCGLTPQYSALEKLAQDYGDRGLTVVGVPCNQFMGQEPGTAGEIAEFCSATYGVTFPMTEKVDVNGSHRHPIYEELALVPTAGGTPRDISWNFEKFLVDGDGRVIGRFRPKVQPQSPEIRAAIETLLA